MLVDLKQHVASVQPAFASYPATAVLLQQVRRCRRRHAVPAGPHVSARWSHGSSCQQHSKFLRLLPSLPSLPLSTMASLPRVAALAALLLSSAEQHCSCVRAARAASPCDDGMDSTVGAQLNKVQSPDAAAVRWAVPFTAAAVRDTNLNKVFRKKNCKFVSYTVKKLCVPTVRCKPCRRARRRRALPPRRPPMHTTGSCNSLPRLRPPCRPASPAASG